MIADKLEIMFPGIAFGIECILQDDGDGNVYISAWNRPEPEPTMADIIAIPDATAAGAIMDRRADLQRAPELLKALALATLDEINTIRTNAGAQAITPAQWKDRIKAKL